MDSLKNKPFVVKWSKTLIFLKAQNEILLKMFMF